MNGEQWRDVILREAYIVWRKQPDSYAIIAPGVLLKDVLKKHSSALGNPVVQGALRSLAAEEFIKVVSLSHPSEGSKEGLQITAAGRQHLVQKSEQQKTRIIAVIGAVTGAVGALTGIVALLVSKL